MLIAWRARSRIDQIETMGLEAMESLDMRERLAVVENDLRRHRDESKENFGQVNARLDNIASDIKSFTELLNKAKGAKWLLALVVAFSAWMAGVGDFVRHLAK